MFPPPLPPTMNLPTRKLLVLDLDETLIHASERPLEHEADFELGAYFVYRRPHLEEFLRFAFAHFEVGVWTSSGEVYAEGIVSAIFSEQRPAFVWAGRRCSLRRDFNTDQYIATKRLAKLKSLGYALEQMIAIDDSPEKHGQNYGNLVRVKEFNGETDDAELALLQKWLPAMKEVANVRKIEKRFWRQQAKAG